MLVLVDGARHPFELLGGPSELTTAEQRERDRLETRVLTARDSWESVGADLRDLKEKRLYRSYGTWAQYVDDRLDISWRQANRLIRFARFRAVMGPMGPPTERRARQLGSLSDEDARAIGRWIAENGGWDAVSRSALDDELARRTAGDEEDNSGSRDLTQGEAGGQQAPSLLVPTSTGPRHLRDETESILQRLQHMHEAATWISRRGQHVLPTVLQALDHDARSRTVKQAEVVFNVAARVCALYDGDAERCPQERFAMRPQGDGPLHPDVQGEARLLLEARAFGGVSA